MNKYVCTCQGLACPRCRSLYRSRGSALLCSALDRRGAQVATHGLPAQESRGISGLVQTQLSKLSISRDLCLFFCTCVLFVVQELALRRQMLAELVRQTAELEDGRLGSSAASAPFSCPDGHVAGLRPWPQGDPSKAPFPQTPFPRRVTADGPPGDSEGKDRIAQRGTA